MMFTYVNAGWEGSSHDLLVLNDSLSQHEFDFPHPKLGTNKFNVMFICLNIMQNSYGVFDLYIPHGNYYLVDSAYPNTTRYLAPYSGKTIRYHIPEFKSGSKCV